MSSHWRLLLQNDSEYYDLESTEEKKYLYVLIIKSEGHSRIGEKPGYYLTPDVLPEKGYIYLATSWPEAREKAEKLLTEHWEKEKKKFENLLKYLSEADKELIIEKK